MKKTLLIINANYIKTSNKNAIRAQKAARMTKHQPSKSGKNKNLHNRKTSKNYVNKDKPLNPSHPKTTQKPNKKIRTSPNYAISPKLELKLTN